ncbi:MAG: hypothetical protein IH848_04995, partial [Acidobacteria bacterium]|nr:hypothetical protein [Acidobacteriota bacterium]
MSEYRFLPHITGPADIKTFTDEELQELALEMRHAICGQVSKSGGHLAPNLGVIELTIALHRVFDFSHDRLLFDVGHQCYPHKLLTGRFDQLHTLRQSGGMAGFPEPRESAYDLFSVGHAGTSISTAVGMARKSQIEGRILSVLDSGRNRADPSKSLLFMGVVVLCCVSVPVAMLQRTVQGQEQKKEKGIAKQKTGSELQKGQKRLLKFPADKAVGMVYTRPRRADGYGIFHTFNTFNNWKRFGVARGDVRVPANADVRLDITRDSSTNLSFLDKLSPDAIQTMLLTNTRVDDSGLEHIGRLTGLKYLDLTYTKITDRGIQHLESLMNLEHISLDGLRVKEKEFTVGDDGLAVLSKLPALKQLDLIRSNVTDKGMAHLSGNKSLLSLGLWGNNITNEGLVHLKDLSGLEYLRLGGDGRKKSEINDKGLQHLASLTNLKFLQLNHMEITDEGLKHLRNFPRLESLVIEDTNVTNAGMIHLLPLKSLKYVRLYGLGLNDEGMKHLSSLSALERLTLHATTVSDGSIDFLSPLTSLQALYVNYDTFG